MKAIIKAIIIGAVITESPFIENIDKKLGGALVVKSERGEGNILEGQSSTSIDSRQSHQLQPSITPTDSCQLHQLTAVNHIN